MTVLITGAPGFIGSRVVRLAVDAGCEVHAIVRRGADPRRIAGVTSRVTFHRGDLEDPVAVQECIAACRPSLCIHHAWYAEPGKYLDSQRNIEALAYTIRLVNTLAEFGCNRFAGIGTCFEYEHGLGYLSEHTLANPSTLYAACKHSASLILKRLCAQHGMEFQWLRLFYLYGPFEDPRRIVPYIITSVLRDEPALLSAGDQIRDFLHVDDVASAIWTASTSNITGNVNIGSGSPVTIAALAAQVGDLLRRPDLIRLGVKPKTPYDPPFIVANPARLIQETGWRARHDLESGLAHTIRWWREQLQEQPLAGAAAARAS